jgi:hypothetical protein
MQTIKMLRNMQGSVPGQEIGRFFRCKKPTLTILNLREDMNYKNANIKTMQEAKERLDNGERLFCYGTEIYVQIPFISGASPYRIGKSELVGFWDLFKEWQVETEWYDNIPEKGVLCWTSPTYTKMDVIRSYDSEGLHPINYDECYNIAFVTPLTEEEKRNLLQ